MARRLFYSFIGLFLGLAISAASAFPAHADGTLDPAFGNGGIVITDIGEKGSHYDMK